MTSGTAPPPLSSSRAGFRPRNRPQQTRQRPARHKGRDSCQTFALEKPPVSMQPHQNINFNMSCRIRGSLAEVIFPKPGVPTVAPGPLKLTLLNTLKNSARNCSFTRSVRLVFLITPRSVLKERGPRRIFLPEMPNVPNALDTKSDVLKNRSTIWACDSPLSLA